MRKKLLIVLGVLLLQACGTRPFTPAEYPLDADLIPAFNVNGQVTITNAQPSTDPFIVYSYGGSKLSSDLHAITSVMTLQAIEELHKHGHMQGGTKAKTIDLKVNSLVSDYKFFYWSSNLQLEAKLGNGQVLDLTVPHSSGVLAQDLDGCIAESVMTLFKNDKVKAYLAG